MPARSGFSPDRPSAMWEPRLWSSFCPSTHAMGSARTAAGKARNVAVSRPERRMATTPACERPLATPAQDPSATMANRAAARSRSRALRSPGPISWGGAAAAVRPSASEGAALPSFRTNVVIQRSGLMQCAVRPKT